MSKYILNIFKDANQFKNMDSNNSKLKKKTPYIVIDTHKNKWKIQKNKCKLFEIFWKIG